MACTPDASAPKPTPTDTAPDSAPVTETAETAETTETADTQRESADTAPAPIAVTQALAQNPDNPFSLLVTVTVDTDADVFVAYGESTLDHQTPARHATAGVPLVVPVFGLREGHTFLVETQTQDGRGTSDAAYWATAAPTGEYQSCTVTFTASESEYDRDEAICGNSRLRSGGHVYMCWDRWGEPIQALRTASDTAMLSMTALPDGGWASTGYNDSKLVVFDELGAETAEYTAAWFTGTRFQHDYIDVHEVTPITDGPWAGAIAFTTATYESFSDGTYRLGNGFIVYDLATDTVLYDYSFHGVLGDDTEMDPMMPYSRIGWGDYKEDWTHLNSIVHGLDDDGRDYFLLSLKAQNWIFKLYPDTDTLAWRLGQDGDFTLVDDVDAASPVELAPLQWQSHQHGMFLLSATGGRTDVLMFDNGYPRQDGAESVVDPLYSRVVELTADQTTRRAELTFAWGPETAGPDYFFSSSRGNAELLPSGDRLLFLSGEEVLMREIAYPAGGERWKMACPYDDDGMYRAHWFPDLYQTDWAFHR